MSTPLGDFIRARRDATRPESVGLPAGPRRRVPGLRRSELAGLAGMSVEYLIRIEQGRDRNPSVSVVNAIAEAGDGQQLVVLLPADGTTAARPDGLRRNGARHLRAVT